MGQKGEPAGADQVYVLGLDDNGNPRGARFTVLRDSIVSAAIDMNCRVLIRQPPEVCALARKLPLGYVLGTGKIVRLLIPRIGYDLYRQTDFGSFAYCCPPGKSQHRRCYSDNLALSLFLTGNSQKT